MNHQTSRAQQISPLFLNTALSKCESIHEILRKKYKKEHELYLAQAEEKEWRKVKEKAHEEDDQGTSSSIQLKSKMSYYKFFPLRNKLVCLANTTKYNLFLLNQLQSTFTES